MPTDPILDQFLAAQYVAAARLAAESDIVRFLPLAPDRWMLQFHCRSLAGLSATTLREVNQITVGIWFHRDYLRLLNAAQVVTLLDPLDLWHPNVAAPHICVGDMSAGTTLKDLAYQLFEIFTWQKYNTLHGMNRAAMEWTLHHRAELPLDRRTLCRRPGTTPESSS